MKSLDPAQKAQLAAVHDRLIGTPDTQPESIAREVAGLPIAPTSRLLFSLLRRHPREIVIDRVIRTLAFVDQVDDAWHAVVQRSLVGSGRCPKPLRRHLRATISARRKQTAPPNAADLTAIRKPTAIKTHRVAALAPEAFRADETLRLSTADTSLESFPQELLRHLSRISDSRRRVQIDLDEVDHLYIFGIGLLATWLRSTKRQARVASATESTRRYLERIGFVDVIEGRRADLWAEDEGWAVALQRLDPASSVFDLTDRLVGIIEKHGLLGSDDKGGLQTTFAELMENVIRHASPFSNAYVGAQFYPRKRKLSIIVIDDGIGIRESFRTGRNTEAAAQATTDEAAVSLAVKPLVTSKPVRKGSEVGHSGYGLYVVSELAVRNAGSFALTSGTSTIMKYSVRSNPKSKLIHHDAWKGTIVSVLFDLNLLLPIREVYKTLPMIEGYSEEDFFDD